MSTDANRSVTLVEILEVVGPFSEATHLIDAAVQRLEREGVGGLASMHFYTEDSSSELAAVITFSDPDQMLEHMTMISGWDEFRRFASMIKLKDMRIHGSVSPEVLAWLSQFEGPVKQYEHHVTGFDRPRP